MNLKKYLIALMFVLVLAPAVFADATITYRFDRTAVNGSVYICLDQGCNSVDQPRNGLRVVNPQSTNGEVTIVYPTTLLSQFGYVEYFTASGFRPKVGKHNWNSNGATSEPAPGNPPHQFTQMPNACRATVSNFNLNNVAPGELMQINTQAQLEAQTASAFQIDPSRSVGYLPPHLIQEFYGADTTVTLDILNQTGSVVHTQVQQFTAQNNNAIIAGTSIPVQFTYTPLEAGAYTARITADVIDDQCASHEARSTSNTFSAISQQPTGQFVNILNGLRVDNTLPFVGDTVQFSFEKVTYHADGQGVFAPVQTDLNLTIERNGQVVHSQTRTVPANNNIASPDTYSFTHTFAQPGAHTIRVTANANSILPTSLPEIIAQQTLQLDIANNVPINQNVIFNVLNSSGLPIDNATVRLNGQIVIERLTNSTGQASFSLASGSYDFTISAAGYQNRNEQVSVGSSNRIVSITLQRGNTAPTINLPPSINFTAGNSAILDLNLYANDAEDLDSVLIYTIENNANTTFDIFQGVATITSRVQQPAEAFEEMVTVRVNDTQNATASDTMLVTVNPSGTSVLSLAMPQDVQFNEDSSAVRFVDLHRLTTAPVPASQLTYAVTSTSNTSLITATIENNQFVTILGQPNAFGSGTVTVSVTDGTNTVSRVISVTVSPINDAPVIISVPVIPAFNRGQPFTINLRNSFLDVDGDQLVYTVSQTPGVQFVVNNSAQELTIIPDRNVVGSRNFDITATDPSRLSVSGTFTIVPSSVDEAPFFVQTIPNIITNEEIANNLDLSAFEDDIQDGPGGDNNGLTWKARFANESGVPSIVLSGELFTATINSNSDNLIIVPNVNQSGSRDITLFLFDTGNFNTSQNITITVNNVNDAPSYTNTINIFAELGAQFNTTVFAFDSDPTGDTLSFRDNTSLFNIARINNTAAEIRFTPQNKTTEVVELEVCDNHNACSQRNITVTVTDGLPPRLVSQTTPHNETYDFNKTYIWNSRWTDNNNISQVVFEFEGTNVTVNESATSGLYITNKTDLPAGTYQFRWYAIDSDGNLNATNLTNATILKATSNLGLFLNGSVANMTVDQNDNVTVLANMSNTFGPVSVLLNNASLTSGNVDRNNSLEFNHTFPNAGQFDFLARFAGNINYTAENRSLTVFVRDVDAPTFGSSSVLPLTAIVNDTVTFRQNVFDNVNVTRVLFERNNMNFTPSQVGNSSLYEINVTGIPGGVHQFRWFAQDAAGNLNSTNFTNYTVAQNASGVILNVFEFNNSLADPVVVEVLTPLVINVNLTNPAGGIVNLTRNGTSVANQATPFNFSFTPQSIGVFNFTGVFGGNSNFSSSQATRLVNVIPTQVPQFGTETISPASQAQVGQPVNFRRVVTDNVDINNVTLEIGNTNRTATRVSGSIFEVIATDLLPGNYTYRWFATDNANNMNNTPLANYTVVKIPSVVLLTLNGAANNITVEQNEPVESIANVTTPANALVELLVNGVVAQSTPNSINLTRSFATPGIINITAVTPGNINFTREEVSRFVNVIPSIVPSFGTETISPVSPTPITQQYTFRRVVTDNGGVQNVTLQIDNINHTAQRVGTSNIFEAVVAGLTVGNHTYVWHARDSVNNTNSSTPQTYEVTKAASALELTLNGQAGNINVEQNAPVLSIVRLVVPGAGNVELFVNSGIASSGASPVNSTDRFSAVGQVVNVTAVFAGNVNFTPSTITRFVTITAPFAPTFGTQTITPSSPAPFSPAYTFRRIVTDNGAVNNVTLQINGTNFTASRIGTGSLFEANVTGLNVGTHQFVWFAEDDAGNRNNTSPENYTVVPIQPTIAILLNNATSNINVEQGQPVVIVANATSPAGANIELRVDGTLENAGPAPVSTTKTFATVGTVNITAVIPATGNFGRVELTRILTVTPAQVPQFGTETITPSSPAPFNPVYNFRRVITDNGVVQDVFLELDGSQLSASRIGTTNEFEANLTNLTVGNHTYRWIATDNAGNIANTSFFTYEVIPGQSSNTLTLNGFAGDTSVEQNAPVVIFAEVVNPVGSQVNLYVNGILNATGTQINRTDVFTATGQIVFTAEFVGNVNASASNVTKILTVTPAQVPQFETETITPSSPAPFSPIYNFRRVITDNGVVANVTFELDNSTNVTASKIGTTNEFEANLTSLTVGNHTYRWIATDNAGNSNNTASANYVVSPGTASIELFLNGVDGNNNAQINDSVNITANVVNPTGGFVELFVNGTSVGSGNSPFTVAQNFSTTGTVTVLASFAGNANVSAGNVTRTLTIIPTVGRGGISPATAAHFNLSSFQMTVNTTGITTCSWDSQDVAQGVMRNNFTTSNGTAHTGTITNLTLGTNSIHVACNGESAATNADLVYFADNILDGSTLSGTNSISNTIMTSSTLNNDTLSSTNGTANVLTNVISTNSRIERSILTSCTVTNSIILDNIASNCNYIGVFIDPSTTTGSNIVGGSIINSTVTFSNVTNSNITNSNINNSVIDDSTITNSSFVDATVIDAVITNDVITAGFISVGNQSYNATTSGTANLSDVISFAPVASFTLSPSSTTPGSVIAFTSTSTDRNIPGDLNDSLSFFWDFGDGTNSTNASVNKSYSSADTYTVTLTVTDSFGYSDSEQGTARVSTPAPAPSGGGGGGGGGGLGSINLDGDATTVRTIRPGQPLRFRLDGKLFQPTLILRTVNLDSEVTGWMINGRMVSAKKGEPTVFDISGDGIGDLQINVLDVARTSVRASFGIARAAPVTGFIPGINPFENFGQQPTTPSDPALPELVEEPAVGPTGGSVTEVPVTADIPAESLAAKFVKMIQSIVEALVTGFAAKVIIVIGVVILGLIAYGVFVRYESSF
ncbi:hypothetical protein COV18_04490 [Candidatus Woesearchaeota archaeon CG10_big_fil_rev_8_21_14_0_10_37_12]|nr:MAG: hypothetical protein COV18_04490 [Candidatus Woesearchaeota archaeon CG10_big_fil_rev_8_21_14_0_10_37_12]